MLLENNLPDFDASSLTQVKRYSLAPSVCVCCFFSFYPPTFTLHWHWSCSLLVILMQLFLPGEWETLSRWILLDIYIYIRCIYIYSVLYTKDIRYVIVFKSRFMCAWEVPIYFVKNVIFIRKGSMLILLWVFSFLMPWYIIVFIL